MSNGVLHRTSQVDTGMVKPLPYCGQWTPVKLARNTAILGILMQKDWINQRQYATKYAHTGRYVCFAIAVL